VFNRIPLLVSNHMAVYSQCDSRIAQQRQDSGRSSKNGCQPRKARSWFFGKVLQRLSACSNQLEPSKLGDGLNAANHDGVLHFANFFNCVNGIQLALTVAQDRNSGQGGKLGGEK
jgi:hypothetical protein